MALKKTLTLQVEDYGETYTFTAKRLSWGELEKVNKLKGGDLSNEETMALVSELIIDVEGEPLAAVPVDVVGKCCSAYITFLAQSTKNGENKDTSQDSENQQAALKL